MYNQLLRKVKEVENDDIFKSTSNMFYVDEPRHYLCKALLWRSDKRYHLDGYYLTINYTMHETVVIEKWLQDKYSFKAINRRIIHKIDGCDYLDAIGKLRQRPEYRLANMFNLTEIREG